MTHETVPQNQRIYMVISKEGDSASIELSALPPEYDNTKAVAVLLSRGMMLQGFPAGFSMPLGGQIEVVGEVTVTQRATVAIAAGVRSVMLDLAGVQAGDALVPLAMGALPAGYMIGGATAPQNGKVQITLQAPLLAIGATYSIPCRIIRLRA